MEAKSGYPEQVSGRSERKGDDVVGIEKTWLRFLAFGPAARCVSPFFEQSADSKDLTLMIMRMAGLQAKSISAADEVGR